MDAIGSIKLPSLNQTVTLPAAPAPQAAALPKPAETAPLPTLPSDAVLTAEKAVDLAAADRRRLEAVRQAAAREIANPYIVGDKTFTIFKDITGQYITRFTSLRDGRVTYIPEPELLKSTSSQAPLLLDIKA